MIGVWRICFAMAPAVASRSRYSSAQATGMTVRLWSCYSKRKSFHQRRQRSGTFAWMQAMLAKRKSSSAMASSPHPPTRRGKAGEDNQSRLQGTKMGRRTDAPLEGRFRNVQGSTSNSNKRTGAMRSTSVLNVNSGGLVHWHRLDNEVRS